MMPDNMPKKQKTFKPAYILLIASAAWFSALFALYNAPIGVASPAEAQVFMFFALFMGLAHLGFFFVFIVNYSENAIKDAWFSYFK